MRTHGPVGRRPEPGTYTSPVSDASARRRVFIGSPSRAAAPLIGQPAAGVPVAGVEVGRFGGGPLRGPVNSGAGSGSRGNDCRGRSGGGGRAGGRHRSGREGPHGPAAGVWGVGRRAAGPPPRRWSNRSSPSSRPPAPRGRGGPGSPQPSTGLAIAALRRCRRRRRGRRLSWLSSTHRRRGGRRRRRHRDVGGGVVGRHAGARAPRPCMPSPPTKTTCPGLQSGRGPVRHHGPRPPDGVGHRRRDPQRAGARSAPRRWPSWWSRRDWSTRSTRSRSKVCWPTN